MHSQLPERPELLFMHSAHAGSWTLFIVFLFRVFAFSRCLPGWSIGWSTRDGRLRSRVARWGLCVFVYVVPFFSGSVGVAFFYLLIGWGGEECEMLVISGVG
ncbi:hypothetical protein B0J12DRAFT_61277 [Macrophomina phaseolina]|uniref:Uncharacterized protein n=1 Tax=Macrophomina phaseolina TaxID=35725 RepID=A0ABQ8GCG4_9PEZI|nr:hypothetical protein B0J12DRAFT_61277 [Macrophomina phaseolina]